MRLSILPHLALLSLTAAQAAQAHVVFAEPQAQAGSYYAGFLRVSHGCDGSATTVLRVELPIGAEGVKPQPKPGWALSIERIALATPIKGEGGGEVRDRVSAVIWTGRLPADQFDQFGLMMKIGAVSGPLYFPTTQFCEKGSIAWTTIPTEGQAWHMLKTPAPVLDIGAAPTVSHTHH